MKYLEVFENFDTPKESVINPFTKIKNFILNNINRVTSIVDKILSEEQQEKISLVLEDALGKSRFEMNQDDINLANVKKVAAKLGDEVFKLFKSKFKSLKELIGFEEEEAVIEESGFGLFILVVVVLIILRNINKSQAIAKEIYSDREQWEETRLRDGNYQYTKDDRVVTTKYGLRIKEKSK